MKFIKQVINLWRIRRAPTEYDKGILTHLSINPKHRKAVEEWQVAKHVINAECDR